MDIERINNLRKLRDEIERMIDEEMGKVGQAPTPYMPYTPYIPTIPVYPTYPTCPTWPPYPTYPIITWSANCEGYA